jgi:tripartite-type tricarboxylate transporter receptor subunit TctC
MVKIEKASRFVGFGFLAFLSLSANVNAQTDDFPNRPIQLVVPFSPGASTDLAARFLGPYLSNELGKPVLVENRAGAGGIVGASYVAKANPDGYTLLVASSTVLQSPLLQQAPAFDATRNFAPIAAVMQHPFSIIISSKLPAHNLAEFIAYAKAHPGSVNTGSLGGFSDVLSAMFIHDAGIQAQIVPYRGAAEALIGLIRGDAHLMFTVYGAVQGQIASDQVRLIGVTSAKRSPLLPDVPTLAEQGMSGFDVINVIGVLAPAGTPQPIIDRLSKLIAKIMSTQAGRDFAKSTSTDPASDFSPGYYAALISAADKKYSRVVEDLHISKQ